MSKYRIEEVMLVDDDAIVRMVTTKILRSLEFQGAVSSFENGRSAIDSIRARYASDETAEVGPRILLLLDINMPIMDGWGFLDEFLLLHPKIKSQFLVVIVTSSIDTNDRVKASSYPDVVDFITKPLSGRDLTDFLAKHTL
jgi:CheY-like chemotaxis protein